MLQVQLNNKKELVLAMLNNVWVKSMWLPKVKCTQTFPYFIYILFFWLINLMCECWLEKKDL